MDQENVLFIHKASLNKDKKIEIIPSILSDHNLMKLKFNNKKKQQKIFKQLEAE
jgi:hypothetical protein